MRIIGYWVHWQTEGERWRFFDALDTALTFAQDVLGPKWIEPEVA